MELAMKTKPIFSILIIGLFLFTACNPGIVFGAEQVLPVEPKPYLEIESDTDQLQAEPAPAADLPIAAEQKEPAQPEVAAPADENDTISVESENRPVSWSDETHSKSADPNFEVVFPQDEVNRLDISIDSANWAAMMADMTSIYGEFGSRPRGGLMGGGVRPGNGNPPEGGPGAFPNPLAEGDGPQGGGNFQGPGGIGGGTLEGDEYNPIWVPATVEFEGDTWEYVGVRFKGNSSLKSSWGSGNLKLPFKLDFDEFEDDHPEIDDQRFYGFKQLTLSSNFMDSSFLREKVAADIFREAGIAAAHTAFYQVYVDYGAGPVYFGLYTMVEVVDDTVIEEQFSDDNGNVYKPHGTGASFAARSFSTEFFDKETNEAEADWSDIEALYRILHADLRMTNPAQWRAELESVFDVPTFLNWLAVNTAIQNWDTYGIMYHNYYLYHNPETGLLTWIPWDNNEAFKEGNRRAVLSFDMSTVSDQWPLISYLLADPVYEALYIDYVAEVINGPFNPDELKVQYQEFHDLIAPYVVGPHGEIDGYTHLGNEVAFENSVANLIQHAFSRYKAAQAYLRSVD